MPQLDPEHFASQLFWLVITFGFFYLLMTRMVLPRITEVLEERQDKVDDDLSRAERLKAETEEVLAEYDQALGTARETAVSQLREASDRITAETTARQDAFTKELAAKSAAAEQRIADAQAEAMANLKQVATEAAQAITSKLVGLTPADEAASDAVEKSLEGTR